MASDQRSYRELTGKPRPIEGAPAHGRRLLGALLAQRRAELGYTHWPAFARDRLPLTPSGNPNTRLLADIEKAYRDNFPEPRLRQLARAYGVTYESLVAVAHMRAGDLIPSSPGDRAPSPPAVPGLPPPPQSELVRDDAVRPYADPIWVKLLELQRQGTADPSGAQLGLSEFYAREWDRSARVMILSDRVWLIGTLLRNAAAWNEDRQPGAGSA